MPTENPLTVDQLVNVLKHSQKPGLVVEGDDDVIIYRELTKRIGTLEVIIRPSGGRENLLQVYERRSEFSHIPVAFIADRDMWLFRGIPSKYKDIIWTDGYSIENDLYSSVKLRDRVGNKSEYNQVLDSISMWFAYKVEEYLEKNPLPPAKVFLSIQDEEHVHVDLHCNRIVPKGNTTLASDLESLPADHERVKEVRKEYNLQLRGKLLFQLLVRFLNKPKQGFTDATVSYYSLYNDAITVPESEQLFSRLESEVKEKLEKQKMVSQN